MSKQPLTQGEFEQRYGPNKASRLSRAKTGDLDMVEGRPRFPQGLSPAAKVIFKRLTKDLESRRQITPADREVLASYARLSDTRAKAQAALEAEGVVVNEEWADKEGGIHTRQKTNLYWPVVLACEKQQFSILQSLGLTPTARHKVKPVKADKSKVPLPPDSVGAALLEYDRLREEEISNADSSSRTGSPDVN
jgi:P27 family predicted phage terminase small subunit